MIVTTSVCILIVLVMTSGNRALGLEVLARTGQRIEDTHVSLAPVKKAKHWCQLRGKHSPSFGRLPIQSAVATAIIHVVLEGG